MSQTPVFLSMFYGLGGIAKLPVESFKTGGMLWFPDLTIADPYYILPAISALSVALVTKVGGDCRDQFYLQLSKVLKQRDKYFG